MTSSRSFWVAALAIAVGLLGGGAGTAAAATHGVGGFITDADTGLPLAQSTATWAGTTPSSIPATSDSTGRYAIFGLQPGEAGALTVVGPAGWDRITVAGMTIPADEVLLQNIQLHRDWASTAGGGKTTSNDEAAAGAGCASTAATDLDPSTGWSAATNHPASDAAALTVQLPQAIDVSQFTITPGSACGHDAGTALGQFKLQTSQDGTTWADAVAGTLAADARGKATPETPTANASNVRYVRLLALSAQDPAATSIDVRELEVYGAGPNVAPSGTVTPDIPKNYISQVVHLTASFTDPDTSIVHYLWDFDGDGKWDQVTAGPTVSHVWAGAGSYHVTVGARDFRGALGTASVDLRIVDPNQPLEPIPQRKPLITFESPQGIDMLARIACASKCTFTAKMTLTATMARKLDIKHRTIFTLKRHTSGPGIGTWTLELPQKVIKKARAANLRKLKVRLTCSAIDQQKRRSTVHRWVTFN